MPRIQMTRTVRVVLALLVGYLVSMLTLILIKFLRVV